MGDWAEEFVFFGPWQDRKRAAIANFPPRFNGVTLILDGKAFPLREFSSSAARSLYLPEMLTKKDYMCYKHKPAKPSMLVQVCQQRIYLQ